MRVLFSTPPKCGLRPAIFLDRDGVLNERVVDGYVTKWEEFRFVAGMPETLASLARLDLPILVVSNQACVGKGLLDERQLEGITRRFVAALEAVGGRVDGVYYCPHRSDENCCCRKPRPGLLERARQDWRIDLNRSVLVGDSVSDLDAAAAVGCRAVLFGGATGLAAKITEVLRAS